MPRRQVVDRVLLQCHTLPAVSQQCLSIFAVQAQQGQSTSSTGNSTAVASGGNSTISTAGQVRRF